MSKALVWEIIGGIVILIAHSTLIGMWVGRLTARIKTNDEECEKLSEQLIHFVTHDKCRGINDRWQIQIEAALKYRDGLENRNTGEHDGIIDSMRENNERFMKELERINIDRKDAAEKITARLDKMSECLHKIQIQLAQTRMTIEDGE